MATHIGPRPMAGGCGHDLVGDGGEEPMRLAAALLDALERALLAARHLASQLDAAGGCHGAGRGGEDAGPAPVAAPSLPPRRVPPPHPLSDLRWASGRVAEVDRALAEGRVAFARVAALLARDHADRLAATLAPPWQFDGLTDREVAVLRLVAAGRSNREAAAALAVSERTVERHLESIYRRIGARNRADAVAYAVRHT